MQPATSFLRRAFRALGRAGANRTYRHQLFANLGLIRGVFQVSNLTFEDRYPEIFNYVKSQLGEDFQGRILSFGCASGEEVFTLRRYLPHARIHGVDFNPGNIAECRRKWSREPDAGLSFEVAKSTVGMPSSSFEAIFCMAVLRHGAVNQPGVLRCDGHILFDDFSTAIADFERCLKPGGLLVIRHHNFFVSDTPSAANFEAVATLQNLASDLVFGRDNRLIRGAKNHEAVFRKRGQEAR